MRKATIQVLPSGFITSAVSSKLLQKGKWPWVEGVRSRLPEHFKKRFIELYTVKPCPVHYIENTAKYEVDIHGVRHRVVNEPIEPIYPKEANQGLWGGEGLLFGYHSKHDRIDKPWAPKLWKPLVKKRILYSEILDRFLSINVTASTLDAIDRHYGFDSYILETHEVDLKSQFGMTLKREMLMALAKGDIHPNNPEKKKIILEKYKKFMIPEEEIEWIGLTIEEAEAKQESIEEMERVRNTRPLKEIYLAELIQMIKEKKLDDVEPETWLSKISPFEKKTT